MNKRNTECCGKKYPLLYTQLKPFYLECKAWLFQCQAFSTKNRLIGLQSGSYRYQKMYYRIR